MHNIFILSIFQHVTFTVMISRRRRGNFAGMSTLKLLPVQFTNRTRLPVERRDITNAIPLNVMTLADSQLFTCQRWVTSQLNANKRPSFVIFIACKVHRYTSETRRKTLHLMESVRYSGKQRNIYHYIPPSWSPEHQHNHHFITASHQQLPCLTRH